MMSCSSRGVGNVSSEIHPDHFFLEGLQASVFQDSDDENENKQETNRENRTTSFAAIPPVGSAAKGFEVQIDHHSSSEVDLVGLQVWRGALLLSDYLLAHPDLVKDKAVMELAAGTGITSVVAGTIAKSILVTDVDRGGILDLIRRNICQNSSILADCSSKVCEVDFFREDWKISLASHLSDVDVVLAADVVYDRDITRHFFRTLSYLMESNRLQLVLLAVERRCQIGEDGTSVAPNFDYFLELLSNLMETKKMTWKLEKIKLDFHRYFQCYDRVNELNFWKISHS